jgi:hypothetical protein
MDLELERLGTLRRRVDEETRARAVLRVQDLDVDGEDVMRSLGIGPGPEVGRVLERLLERVIESPSDNQRPVLLAWLEQERKRL